MLFGKNRTKAKRMPARECTLDPVLHVIETLKDYRTELVQKEVSSLEELDKIGNSYGGVLREAEKIGRAHV